MGPPVRVPVAVAIVLVVQDAVLRSLRVDGVRPDLLLGLTIVTGVLAGAERGAIVGFLAGLVADLFVATPFGISALVWCLLGYTTGALQSAILPQGRAAVPFAAFIGSAAGEVLFALAGSVLGQPGMVTPHLVSIALIVAAVNAVVSVPLVKLVRWSVSAGPESPSFAP
jgi:rod shape-determining protein MreD